MTQEFSSVDYPCPDGHDVLRKKRGFNLKPIIFTKKNLIMWKYQHEQRFQKQKK